ncbi:Crp/Fnr family transcriptional regulator [Parapedobacter deserti]|uniref:Crp/Fnr family transcriptional regulator n=1 Tax=Parapedobacter deserti TaxID=1912957 RepID=A0ABV7JSI1_9SPHI
MHHSNLTLAEAIREANLFEKTITLPRNAYLKEAGSVDTNLYLVEAGSLRVFVWDGQEQRIVRFGYEKDLIVALDSLLTGVASDFAIQALKKTRLQVLPKHVLMQFVQADLRHLLLWNSALEALVIQQLEREKDLLTSSPSQRYQRVLERSPQLFQHIPHKYIANYLRMTPETLSRLKKS